MKPYQALVSKVEGTTKQAQADITLTFEVQFRKLTNANQMCVQYLQTCQVSLLTTFLFYLYFCSTRLVLRTSGTSCG